MGPIFSFPSMAWQLRQPAFFTIRSPRTATGSRSPSSPSSRPFFSTHSAYSCGGITINCACMFEWPVPQ
ncbi:MAG TPA: hypothetical protein DDX05_01785 [Deltaproteobacteria bacterium]|nr:hypothetical protein [Deltaproteobacteria bacterium]HBG72366.1 hypothetical protein [Deltaproteobacteria bacterium]